MRYKWLSWFCYVLFNNFIKVPVFHSMLSRKIPSKAIKSTDVVAAVDAQSREWEHSRLLFIITLNTVESSSVLSRFGLLLIRWPAVDMPPYLLSFLLSHYSSLLHEVKLMPPSSVDSRYSISIFDFCTSVLRTAARNGVVCPVLNI